MNKDTIFFGELDKFNDTNSAVLMAITLDNDDDITNLNDVIHGDIVNRLIRRPCAGYRQAEQRENCK